MHYRRTRLSGGTFFFTLVTEQRRPLLVENIARLRSAFHHVCQRRPFSIDAIVVLPDHLHALLTLPAGDCDYSSRWMQIKRFFSAGLSAAPSRPSHIGKREKGIWQRRFWEHCVRDEIDWRNHMDYIHFNPVKHGYVERAADWPYSSFSRCVDKGLYEEDWGLSPSPELLAMELE